MALTHLTYLPHPTFPLEAALDAPMLPVDEPLKLEVLPDPVVEEPLPDPVIDDDVELPPVVQLEADTNETAAAETVDEDRLLGPSTLSEGTGTDAAAPGATVDEDRMLGPSTLFEIVNETEVEGEVEKEKDLDNYEEDFGSYIELDLSEFLDQPAPTVPAADPQLNASAESRGETDAVTPTRNAPAEIHPAAEGIQVAARAPEPAPAEPDEADWLEVVEALRRDVERLDAAPPVPVRMAKPIKKLPRKLMKGKPVQDEWGFFDPEQCGFAALLAKLDEVTQTDDAARSRNRN